MMKKYALLSMILLIFTSSYSQTKQFFKVRVENVSQVYRFSESGVFNTPVEASEPAPLLPGQSYQFSFSALPGSYFSFVTMFVQSNDLFYAPHENGIGLYDENGMPVSGDITGQLYLWDAGTEINQEPGAGPDQAPRQSGPNTGAQDDNNLVRMVNDGYTYPENQNVLRVSLNADAAPTFVVTIENVATDTTIITMDGNKHPALLSPGVWVVHQETAPLFKEGMPDMGHGLENIAEDGDPTLLFGYLDFQTGLPVPLAPGVWALHTLDAPLFKTGEPDRGDGLEAIAEDGNPSMLFSSFSSPGNIERGGSFAIPVGAEGPAPIFPGEAYEMIVGAESGQKLSLATMFVQSNDLFYAPDEMGVSLFNQDATPRTGDITSEFKLWDAGTEANEKPGFGANQAPRQSGPDTGPADPDNSVRLVNDGYTYPDISNVVRVTLEPLESETFVVRISNVSTDSTLQPSDDSNQPVPLSPGVFAVHNEKAPLFYSGQADRGDGLEHIAEDGDISNLVTALSYQNGVLNSGGFLAPLGSEGPGPLLPGHSYEFTFAAVKGTYLSFASMFVPSNDLFYAPDEYGIPLFDEEGEPRALNATGQIRLWDAGTEANEEPGVGENQAQRQSGPDTGPDDPTDLVRMVDDGYTYPATEQVIHVTITPAPLQLVTVRVENVSTTETLKPSDGSMQPVPLSPGVWVVHQEAGPLFNDGMEDRGDGLESISEDGNTAFLEMNLILQESAIKSSVFNTPEGSASPAPIGPGGVYEFEVWAYPGARLSFASMFVPSNDLFFAPDEAGIPLFNEDGSIHSGDVTEYVKLWDVGTEQNEEPGVGPNQVQRQAAANTGPDDPNMNVRMVSDAFTYPDVSQVIRVTINATPTSVKRDEISTAPNDYQLAQNYPNPFNPQTSIQYAITEPQQVSLIIYNLRGQKIRQLVNTVQNGGSYTAVWDGMNEVGNQAASGVYFYTLQTDAFKSTRRMLLLR